jgi:hypothetical protein
MGPGVHLDSMVQEIVWLDDPLKYPYLREYNYRTTAPRKFPVKTWFRRSRYRVIGYEVAEHVKGTGRVAYNRRFWYLKPHDRDLDPLGVYRYLSPAEAMVPSSIGLDRKSIPYKYSEMYREDIKRFRESQTSLAPQEAKYPGDLYVPNLP